MSVTQDLVPPVAVDQDGLDGLDGLGEQAGKEKKRDGFAGGQEWEL